MSVAEDGAGAPPPARLVGPVRAGEESSCFVKEETMLNVRDLIPWSRGREVASGRSPIDHSLVAFQREINRLFDYFWRDFDLPMFGRAERGRGFITPKVDIREDAKEIVVAAELPGLDEKDLEVTMSDNALIIKGEKKGEHEEREGGYTYRERSYGAFQRAIPLDVDVLEDQVAATFKNGVLTITLPKSPDAQKKFKRIAISGGGEEKHDEPKAA
jgi:HSP20 family protein